ncbi:hypothetical protein BT96DRAFT_989260 [Gymnopus androsaceus JB14]|uniref:Uncharacterized protein n=1 Tax=Gymnopus androsaceus JB14 TaxID=1447944 RepID=A0A6A4HYE9_9AGAR|nr:hypothetical protein BT96DRAFT_989260 [Gymnopus androsaceus JB14]
MATSRVFVLCDLWGSMQIDLQAIGRYSSVGNLLIQHIRRSDTMPLRLSVKTTCPYYKLSDEALGVWHALTQESHRWKDVVLDVVPQLLDITRRNFSKLGDDDASKLLRFPILETLRIENLNDIHDYIRRNDSDPLHFLQALPSLQSLHIHGSLFAVTFTLDVARITRLSIPDGLFIGKSLAQLFHSCPCLQNIELGGFFFQEGRLWSMPDITLPVVHTHLTRLCLITKNAASVELIGTERGYSKGLGEDLASLIARSNCNNFSHLTLTSIPGLEALPVLHDVLLKELSLGLNPHMDLVPALVSLEVFISPWVFRTLVGGPSYILPIESSICGLIKSRCRLTATSVDSESNPQGWILTNPLRSLKVVLHKDTKSTIQTAADDDLYSLAIGVMEEIYQGVIFNFGDRYLDDLESAGLELCIG